MRYNTNIIKASTIKELPPSSRPREKLESCGASSLSDLELLCIIIGSGNKTNGVQTLAKKLLDLLDMTSTDSEIDINEIQKIPGIGKAKATIIKASLEFGRRRIPIKRRSIRNAGDLYPYIRHYAEREQECFLCASLNGAHELMEIKVVSIGLVNRTLVHPREVFSQPLKEKATSIIVAHNHPSGILVPSEEDKTVTKQLMEASKILGINLLDHLIFSQEEYFSLFEHDLM
ncbi:MAG: DNA repair protein RadC [Sphaerochaetaceae bacterium]